MADKRLRSTQVPKTGHARIRKIAVADLTPAPENDDLYRPVIPTDVEIEQLAESLKEFGIHEPLVVTADHYIISGHRRYAAAKVAGLDTVPCRVEPFARGDDPDRFLRLLREFNRQRTKTFDEKLREELVSTSPTQAYQSLIAHREEASRIDLTPMTISGTVNRARISPAKQPMLAAIQRVLEERHEYLPLSDRQIHYALLNDPPLKHASKADSRYANDACSYRDLTDLLTRARVAGLIPMNAIADETRPVTTWPVHSDSSQFIRQQIDGLLQNYWRNLMQSQPNHVEVIVEKNTVGKICGDVCSEYCIPVTSGRGYCSLPPRASMASRFRRSGKSKLVLLLVSDFDPDGKEIAHSLAKSMRDDFGIENIHPIKVALTAQQARDFHLPIGLEAKAGSTNYRKFVAKYGCDVWELEALAPAQLQAVLREAIDSVIDRAAFNAELDAERRDATHIAAMRQAVIKELATLDLGGGAGDD